MEISLCPEVKEKEDIVALPVLPVSLGVENLFCRKGRIWRAIEDIYLYGTITLRCHPHYLPLIVTNCFPSKPEHLICNKKFQECRWMGSNLIHPFKVFFGERFLFFHRINP